MSDKELYSRVREIFEYRDGKLYWKVQLNARGKQGSRAGYERIKGSYRGVRFDKKLYQEHRIVFLYHHGYLPACIDHINGDGGDNRIENLRESSLSENQYNRSASSNSKSGLKGVSWNKKERRWLAQITANRQHHYLGLFDAREDAHKAYCEAAKRLHGDFANFGKLKSASEQ